VPRTLEKRVPRTPFLTRILTEVTRNAAGGARIGGNARAEAEKGAADVGAYAIEAPPRWLLSDAERVCLGADLANNRRGSGDT
jgi:hypothetical protein